MNDPTLILPPHRSPKPALKAAGRHTLRSPIYLFRVTARIPRGLRVIFGPLLRWMRDEKYQAYFDLAMAAKITDYKVLRAERDELLAKRRGRVLMLIAMVLMGVGVLQWFGYGWVWQTIAAGVLMLALAVGGRIPETAETIEQQQLVSEPEERVTGTSVADVRNALADAGVIKPEAELRTIAMPRTVGRGVEGIASQQHGAEMLLHEGQRHQAAIHRRDLAVADLASVIGDPDPGADAAIIGLPGPTDLETFDRGDGHGCASPALDDLFFSLAVSVRSRRGRPRSRRRRRGPARW